MAMRFLATLLLAVGTLVACSPPRPTPGTKSSGPAATAVATVELAEVPADPREPVLSQAAVALLTRQHVLRRPIDDALSREAFPKYVEEIDGAKLFLLQPHVDALARYAESMDDELAGGDLALAREGAALIAARRAAVAGVVKELL